MHSDAEAIFVGRFKENKRSRDCEYMINVSSFSRVEASRTSAGNADDADTDALAVYPQRCAARMLIVRLTDSCECARRHVCKRSGTHVVISR